MDIFTRDSFRGIYFYVSYYFSLGCYFFQKWSSLPSVRKYDAKYARLRGSPEDQEECLAQEQKVLAQECGHDRGGGISGGEAI